MARPLAIRLVLLSITRRLQLRLAVDRPAPLQLGPWRTVSPSTGERGRASSAR